MFRAKSHTRQASANPNKMLAVIVIFLSLLSRIFYFLSAVCCLLLITWDNKYREVAAWSETANCVR